MMTILSHVPQSFAGDQPEDTQENGKQVVGMAPGCKQRPCLADADPDDQDDSTELTQAGSFDRLSSEEIYAREYADAEPLDCFDIISRF
jgi:hypothetical protein